MPRFEPIRSSTLPERYGEGLTSLEVPKVWRKTKGAGVVVGVVDSGIAVRHPDLMNAVLESRDFSGSLSAEHDAIGHGTHVAGIIAARKSAIGVVGVAPEAQLLNAKVMHASDRPASASVVAEAIEWCAQAGADIVCLSLEWEKPVAHVREAIAAAKGKGIIVVAAAGNRGPRSGPVGFPAAWPEALAVGYVEFVQGRIRMSVDSAAGPEIDVLAPGSRVLSTFPETIYAYASGSSMAAPFVAGAVALLLAHRRRNGKAAPSLAEVQGALQATANRGIAKHTNVDRMVGLIDPTKFVDA